VDLVAEHAGWERLPEEALPLNVLVWAFDSTSRNNFIRKMKKSWAYIRDHMDGVLMDGYNVIETSTFSALCPLFYGGISYFLNSFFIFLVEISVRFRFK
jgi:hypothetical protein